jgi:sugar phosphate permease
MNSKERVAPHNFTLLGFFIWSLAAFFFLYEFFLRTVMGSLVHELLFSLKITVTQLSLIDISYCIAYGVMQIPIGILIDRFGVKRSLVFAILLCACGVCLFGFANGFYLAFCSRILMGVGSSFAFICLLVLTLNWLPKKVHGTFFGLSQLIGALGPILAGAPVVILLHSMHNDWRSELLLIGAVGFVLALVVASFVKDQPLSIESVCRHRLLSKPIKDFMSLVRNKSLWSFVFYSSAIYVSLALLGTLWGPTYLQTKGMSAVRAAFITSMLWCGLSLGSLVIGVIYDLYGGRKMIMLCAAIIGMFSSLLIIYLPNLPHNNIIMLACFLSLGFAGSGQSLAFLAVAKVVDNNQRASAIGFNNAWISFAIALVIFVVGKVIQRNFGVDVTHFSQADFQVGLLIMPLAYILAFCSCLFE